MRLRTAISDSKNPSEAVKEVFEALTKDLGGAPSWVVLSHGADLCGSSVTEAWGKIAAGSSLHRLTTCNGSMGDFGFEGRGVLAGMGILDEHGAYSSAAGEVGDDVEESVQRVVDDLLDHSERPGEAPDLLFVSTSPGIEEVALQVIQREFGDGVLVAGGSAADDTIEGRWTLGSANTSVSNGLVISALYTSQPVSASFSSGYVPTGVTGTVTGVEGRQILTINDQPASTVYNEWTGGSLDNVLEAGGGMILADSSLYPIGRRMDLHDEDEMYMLSHPSRAVPDGPLDLFTQFAVGDKVELMSGSIDSLVQRGGRVVGHSLKTENGRKPAGALVVYCAGCRLTVGERMPEVPAAIQESLGAPFIGLFTFGEQGPAGGHQSRHGNLMISAVTFYE